MVGDERARVIEAKARADADKGGEDVKTHLAVQIARLIGLAARQGSSSVCVSFDENGWFNATAAASKYGKRPVDWLRMPETKRYVAALARAK